MKKRGFSIGNKILLGFFSLIIIFTIIVSIVVVTNSKNNKLIERSSTVIRPSVNALHELTLLVTKSKMLATNWVHVQGNDVDKKALHELHNVEYPNLKKQINGLKKSWENDTTKAGIDSTFAHFETLLAIEKEEIMNKLVTFDDYEDPFIKLSAGETIESEVFPRSAAIMKDVKKISDRIQKDDNALEESIRESSTGLTRTSIILAIITILIGLIGGFWMSRSITKPIGYIKEIIAKLGKGELPEEQHVKYNKDEIGEMAKAVENLVTGLKSTSSFAENIGNGNYDSDYSALSKKDTLGNSLIDMRNNLKKVAEEDEKRNWITRGLANFSETLRNNNDNIEKLSEDIVINLIQYLGCNQGGLFIVNDDSGEAFLELKACYAWDKQKYLEQKIHIGEGLTGQAWLEKDTVYITEVPDEYITITSGLGQSNPTSILIVPMIVNDAVFGVIELASFKEFADFEIDFIEKLAESIASTVSTVKVNEQTQKLLEESTEMTEQMQSQEEEMRQNMEELQATQEEMKRNQVDMQGILDSINSSLASAEYNINAEITNANDMFLEIYGFDISEIKGRNHTLFLLDADKNSKENGELWNNLKNGETVTGEFERKRKDGTTIWVRSNYSPVKNTRGEVVKILELSFDISNYKS